MPISDRAGTAALSAAVALLLAGCAEPPPGVAGKGVHQPAQALRAIQVAQNDVTIAGPRGYCVDPGATREAPSGAFVLLGSCAALERDAAGGAGAVLTASISQPGLPGRNPAPAELEQFFRSAEGRAALAQDGRASSLTLKGLHARDGVLFLSLRDASAARPDRLADDSWRAIFALDDRVVSLTATSLAEAPLGETELRRTLERFVDAVRAANGQRRAA